MKELSRKRADIKTGFKCNNNCIFCVQAHKKKYGNRPGSDIKKDLDAAKANGCIGVILTGGEVTIRDDVLEIVSYANKLGFEIIQIQTNGRRFFYKDFCRKMIEAGANEFAVAIHGQNAEVHDGLTKANGSFEQTVAGIKNLKGLGVPVIINSVVVKQNYKHAEEIAKLLVRLKVDQFQMAFVHAMGNALDNFELVVPNATESAPYIHKALQIGIDNGVRVMAEAMPFCLMKGYEDYVSELIIPETEVRDVDGVKLDYLRLKKEESKMKFEQCKECKYDEICEGPWREYPENFGSEEFKPVK